MSKPDWATQEYWDSKVSLFSDHIDLKPGDTFYKVTDKSFGKGNIVFVCNLKPSENYDVASLWKSDPPNGTYFGYYIYSGIRAITGELYSKLFKHRIIKS